MPGDSHTDGLEKFVVQHTRNMLPIGTPIPLGLIPLGPESSKLTLRIVVFIVRAHGTIGTIARVGCSPAQPRSHFVECLITALKTCAERLLTITSFQRLEYVHRSCIYTPKVDEQRSERNVKAMASYVQF